MKTTRKKIIQDKIFTKENIRNLWTKIKKEYDDSLIKENYASLKLEINCIDGISYESDTDDLLQDGDIIDTKKCTKISIEYHDYKPEKRISLSLSHGDSYGSGLMVRGDKHWAAGMFESLNDVIDAAKPQEHWFIKHKTLLLHVGAFSFGYIVYELLGLHIQPIKNPSENIQAIRDFIHKNPSFLYIIQGSLFWLEGIFPVWCLRHWVLKLWPSIEFDFGPEHQKNEKRRRKRLGLFFSIIITPLLINLIYDLLTK